MSELVIITLIVCGTINALAVIAAFSNSKHHKD